MKERIAELQAKLAFESCESAINSFGLNHMKQGVVWYDVSGVEEEVATWIAEAVEYLELTGRLDRLTGKPGRVRVKAVGGKQ